MDELNINFWYLSGVRGEDAFSSSDEISKQHREAREAEEEEAGRAGADHVIQNILMK